MQVDADASKVKPYESRYNLNLERSINNLQTALALGENAGNNTPAPGNRLLDLPFLPAGVNTVVASFYSHKTNETYVAYHNSLSNHGVYRVNGDLTVQMVLQDPKLNFQLHARHAMKNRMYLFFNHENFNAPANKLYRKYLVFVDGFNWQFYVDVETSIATNGFRVPYFSTPDRTQLWQLPTRPSLKCIGAEFIPIPSDATDELVKPNLVADDIWQFRIKYIYYDGRPTAWGPISDAVLLQASECQQQAKGRARCIRLTLDAGGPQVEKVLLAFRKCAGNYTTDQNPEWYQTAVIEKYEKCLDSNVPFYTRTIRTDFGYNPAANTFIYTFCNEGTCIPIPKKETDLNYNPIPRSSYALAPLDDRLVLLNNTENFTPVVCESLDKFVPSIVDPIGGDCQVEMATVKFSVIIHNIFRQQNEFIFIYEDSNPDPNEQYRRFFGGLGPRATTTAFDDPGPYKQYFAETGRKAGFIGYVEGGEFYTTTKQYVRFNDGSKVERTPDRIRDTGTRRRISRDLTDNDYYFVSEGEIRVPLGTAGYLRLGSHLSKKTDQFRDTSTTVLGIYRDITTYHANHDLNDRNTDPETFEIFFNTCAGDADLRGTPFIVADLTGPYGDVTNGLGATAMDGYLRDDDGRPVEGALVVPFGGFDGEYAVRHTDHNGYYFISQLFRDRIIGLSRTGVEFFVEGAGCTKMKGGESLQTNGTRPNELLTDNVAVTVPGYTSDFYSTLRVRMVDVNNLPIPGVSIALEGRKSKETGSDGWATLFVRNDMRRYSSVAMALNMIPMQNGVCYLTRDNCNSCMPVISIPFAPCFQGHPEVVYDSLPQFNQLLPVRGLQPGVYPMALKFIDAAGRETFWQGDYEVRIRTFQEKKKYAYSLVRWDITGLMNLPPYFTKMAIGIARNRSYEDFVTWVVDDVEFIDSSGKEATNLSADKIKLSIKSLYDFNTASGYSTNVRYQFEPGDVLQFVSNGDGKIFELPVDNLTFIIEADSNNRDVTLKEDEERYSHLIISYSAELKDLKEGAQIMLIKPRKCDDEDRYYEACPLIDIINGEPAITAGVLNVWDSYLVRRKISYNDQPNVFTFPFLHHSPSDFRGDHCINRGRMGVKNPYEKQMQFGRQAKLSQVLLDNGNFNGLGWFDNDLVKKYSGEQRGDIIAAISREQFILVICEYDHFISMIADDFLRVAPDGTVRALGGDSVVSDAQSKSFGNYGCQYNDVSSIQDGDGWCFWVDNARHAPVLTNFDVARDVSVGPNGEPLMKSFWTKKLQYKRLTGEFKIVSGWDPISKNIMITFFKIATGDINDYVHSRHALETTANETVTFNPQDGTFPTMYGFTPEYFGGMADSVRGNIFFSFKGGVPWVHREIGVSIGYNTFFGVSTDQVFEPVVNIMDDKVKVFLAMQQRTNIGYYSDRILTSEEQESRLPSSHVKEFTEGKYSVDFLCAEKKRNKMRNLFAGERLRGTWMTMRLVRENTVGGKKDTVDATKQMKYNVLDFIIVKFMLSEQSAYNSENA